MHKCNCGQTQRLDNHHQPQRGYDQSEDVIFTILLEEATDITHDDVGLTHDDGHHDAHQSVKLDNAFETSEKVSPQFATTLEGGVAEVCRE